MVVKKYRAVDSNGNVFEVEMLKKSKPADPVEYARAPSGGGYKRTDLWKVVQ